MRGGAGRECADGVKNNVQMKKSDRTSRERERERLRERDQ